MTPFLNYLFMMTPGRGVVLQAVVHVHGSSKAPLQMPGKDHLYSEFCQIVQGCFAATKEGLWHALALPQVVCLALKKKLKNSVTNFLAYLTLVGLYFQ